MFIRLKNLTIIITMLLTGVMVISSVAVDSANSDGSVSPVVSSVPRSMTYQGILKDGEGEIVGNTSFDLACRLFDAEIGGTELWSNVIVVTTDAGGLFTTELANINVGFDILNCVAHR